MRLPTPSCRARSWSRDCIKSKSTRVPYKTHHTYTRRPFSVSLVIKIVFENKHSDFYLAQSARFTLHDDAIKSQTRGGRPSPPTGVDRRSDSVPFSQTPRRPRTKKYPRLRGGPAAVSTRLFWTKSYVRVNNAEKTLDDRFFLRRELIL